MNTESKTIFKPTSAQSDKYTYSSNTVHGCNNCLKTKPQGEAPFRVCVGCKCTRYCSRECQRADWPEHKGFCKKKKQALATVENLDMSALPVALRYSQERALMIEDFARAHTYTFQGALNAIAAEAVPFDFRKKYVLVQLREREGQPGFDGNPAKMYEVLDMCMKDNPTHTKTEDVIMEAAFEQCINQSYGDWERMCRGNSAIWGTLVVMYRVGTGLPWPLPVAISRPYPPPKLFDNEHYLATVKEFTSKGIVFRLIKNVRKQGVLEKSGENWVWKEKTLQELKDNYGVDLTGAFIDPIALLMSAAASA